MIDEVSVIIPTLNEEKYLPKLLDSIVKQKFQGKLQVIVIDGKSEDKTVAIANSFKKSIRDLLVFKTARGIAHQRNSGASRAKYDNLLFIDADMILPRHFFTVLNKRATRSDNFIYSFILFAAEFDVIDYMMQFFFYPFVFPFAWIKKFTPGGIMLTTKSVHERIGGFRKEVVLGEDLDYGRRAVASGAKYRLFMLPFAFHSTRRLRKMGRRNFVKLGLKYYLHLRKHGNVYRQESFDYPFGQYEK